MKDDISKNLEELQNTIKTANLNYEIWWIYKNKETRELYLDAVKTYPLFFQISFHAHFVAMIVSIYRLYETRKDTINIPQLVKLLENKNVISNKDIEEIKFDIKQIKPLWVKVSVLRNNAFGHSSNELDYDEILKEANVKLNQFKEIIDESKSILNKITVLWNNSSQAFNLKSTKDTIKLLEDLKQLKAKNRI